MDNKKIIENRWQLTRKELRNFSYLYEKLNLKTQDRIQEVIKSYNITSDSLYKTISKTDDNRLKRKIEEWEDLDIFKGYFKYRVEELTKGNITYKDLAEILIYGAYIEEQRYLDFEINTLFNNVALDCYNQGRQELNKKKKSILPYLILSSFGLVLVDGCNFRNYFDALVLTNMQETLKQYMILLSQNKTVDVYSELMQRTFDKQRNRLISVNEDKFSGGLDKYATALGNLAFIEASETDNQKVKFISDHCENVTDMCEYMDGMIFNTKDRNKFKRPMGANKSDLTIQDIDIMGLVVGINQPPITNHFHWCHSTLTYMIDKTADELREKIYHNNWFDKLTKYEKDGVKRYLSSASYKVNETLYNNGKLSKEQIEFIENLDSALENTPKFKGIVQRSVHFETQEHLNNILEIFNNKEQIGSWGSYVSSSKGTYDNDMKLQFIINSKNGRDLSSLNDEGGGEILFERKTKFKLMTINRKGSKIIVELEEIE